MKKKLVKVGGSLAIILDKTMLKHLDAENSVTVDISFSDNTIEIRNGPSQAEMVKEVYNKIVGK